MNRLTSGTATPHELLNGLALALLVITMAACGGAPPPATGVTVSIDQADSVMLVGQTLVLTATVTAPTEASKEVHWTSSNETVATVTPEGTVTAAAPGEATITATSAFDASAQDATKITVTEPGSFSDAAWTRQFGTGEDDSASAVAVDTLGNVLVAGSTRGIVEGTPAGNGDAFLRKYSADGEVLWTRQFGTTSTDMAHAVAVDAVGNVLVAGETLGALEGTYQGRGDAFVRKYSPAGEVIWTRQFGTDDIDSVRALAVDGSGNVHLAGYTFGTLEGFRQGNTDAFVRKYSADGDVVWTRQFGTELQDIASAVAVDAAGNVAVAGYTGGDLGGPTAGWNDAFLRKYGPAGNELWTVQVGTDVGDAMHGVAYDSSGNIVVAGYTLGTLVEGAPGYGDAFVSKYDYEGAEIWTRQFGTSSEDRADAIAVDAAGNVLVAGHTYGTLEGTRQGRSDAFVRRYTADGDPDWTSQFGTAAEDEAHAVVVDSRGNVLVAGITRGSLEGEAFGQEDVFVRKYGAP